MQKSTRRRLLKIGAVGSAAVAGIATTRKALRKAQVERERENVPRFENRAAFENFLGSTPKVFSSFNGNRGEQHGIIVLEGGNFRMAFDPPKGRTDFHVQQLLAKDSGRLFFANFSARETPIRKEEIAGTKRTSPFVVFEKGKEFNTVYLAADGKLMLKRQFEK